MKLNIWGRTSFWILISVWLVLVTALYAPVTAFVSSTVLQSFHPVATVGKLYDVSPITQSDFTSVANKEYIYSSYGQDYTIGTDISVMDGRAAALRKFLRDMGSPMTTSAEVLVREADKFKLDWRLVAAISGIESRFCRITPAGTNNCWGWRGGPGGSWQKFEDFDVGIKVVTSRLALGYGTSLSPYEIEPAYCPPCAAGGHNWARAVTQYMNTINSYLEKSRVTK